MTNLITEAMAARANLIRFKENGWLNDDEETSWARLTPKEKRVEIKGQGAALQTLHDNISEDMVDAVADWIETTRPSEIETYVQVEFVVRAFQILITAAMKKEITRANTNAGVQITT